MDQHHDYANETFDPDEIYNLDTAEEPAPAPRRRERQTTKASARERRQPERSRSEGAPRRQPRRGESAAVEHRHRPSIFSRLTDRRIAIFTGVLLILVSTYLLTVAISYYSHVADDQSIVTSESFSTIATHPERVANTGGPVGAWVSHLLFSEWLGVGSLILIFYMFALGLSLVRVRRFRFWSLTSRCLISAIAVSILLGFINVQVPSHIYWGGQHGYILNRQLIAVSGIWGAIAVNILLVTLMVLVYFNDLKVAYEAWQRRVELHRRHRAERQARIEAARRAKEAEEARAAREAEVRAREEARQTAAATQTQASTSVTTPIPADESVDELEAELELPPVYEPEPAEEEESDIPTVDSGDDDDDDDESETIHIEQTDNSPAIRIKAPEVKAAEVIDTNAYDPTAELSRYRFPSLDLLFDRGGSSANVNIEEQEENKERITKTLNDFNIPISRIKATVGPTVTLYEIIPAEGVRIAKIKRLEDDIALSLAALGIRIIAPIPGKGTIGIEVPNKKPQTVSIRTIIGSEKFQECRMDLPMALGCTISNEVFIADLCKMPHLLVAGATGMGKSVGLNTIIASLLYKKHPAELKFVLIDPKMVEFSLYAKLEKHYLAKLPEEDDAIITNVNKAVATLNSLCVEMDNRYALLKMAGARNIKEYNTKFISRSLNPEKGHRFLPYIVVIVDEFADLIMQVGKEVETPIARIAQKARAVGMHMILATQRPSTNVITGVIKANFPGRIAFRVFQMVDSRTILDRPGANQLIGRGDMLFSTGGNIERVQCAFIDTPEVEALCDSIADQVGYPCPYELPEYVAEEGTGGGSMSNVADRDPLFEDAARLVITSGQASTSSLQRRYNIGYNRAGRIMDQMEAAGIVGPSQGGKPRQILIDSLQLERIIEAGAAML